VRWWHVIIATHCSWLPGDRRGFGYQCAPGLVRLEQQSGKLTLTVSRPSGATVTLAATMPVNPQTPKAEESTNDERRA
jgi:hypothetical protein